MLYCIGNLQFVFLSWWTVPDFIVDLLYDSDDGYVFYTDFYYVCDSSINRFDKGQTLLFVNRNIEDIDEATLGVFGGKG